jgi:ABC-2 type transport system permease protein
MITVFELVLKRILKQKLTIALMIIFPMLLIVLPQPQGMESPTLSYGIFGLVILFSAFLLSKQVIEDRQYKTIIRISASPISHKAYLLGHLGAYLLVMIIQITGFWVLGMIVWEASIEFFLFAYVLMLFFTMMAISFCLFWHTFFKTYGTSISIFSIAANLMAVIGGISFPLMYLPDRLRQIAVVLPTYWYAYGLEQTTEKMYHTVLLCLLILLGFAIIFVSIGSKRRFE